MCGWNGLDVKDSFIITKISLLPQKQFDQDFAQTSLYHNI